MNARSNPFTFVRIVHAACAALLPLALTAGSGAAVPSLVVAPNSYSGTEGGTSATYPFGQSSIHYQQVYAGSQFPASGAITEVSFRPDGPLAGGSPFFPTPVSSVTIILSTTSKAPGGLSSTFANNLGSDRTVVYDGSLMLSTSYTGPDGGPNAFDVRIHLATPFSYNPANGNLIMDVVLTNGNAAPPALDAETVSSNPVTSRAYALSANATTATGLDNKGLITQFAFGSFALPSSAKVGWLIFTGNVTGINRVSSSVAQHFFNNAGTLIAGSPSANPVPSGFGNATPLANYNSFAQFQSDLLNNAINTVYTGKVLMYDNESWSKTPSNEQTAAADYEILFANLAHAHGYVYLTAPSPDLTGYPAALPSPTRYDMFLQDGYPGFSAGAPSEAFDIQAQKLETDPSGYQTFEWLVSSCYNAAKTGNPATVAFAGITTTPFGSAPTAAQIAHAVTETYDPSTYVSGYWFNIPDGNYSLAEATLQILENNGL